MIKITPKTKKILKASAVAISLVALPAIDAHAGTTGTEFQNVFNTFKGWVQGYAGAAISIASIGLGGLISLSRQSPLPILVGIGTAILLQYSPDVVTGIITATI